MSTKERKISPREFSSPFGDRPPAANLLPPPPSVEPLIKAAAVVVSEVPELLFLLPAAREIPEMPLASNNDSVAKSVAPLDSPFCSFVSVSLEPLLKLTERKAHRFSISYSQTYEAPAGDWYSSPDFTVGGFRWCIQFYPHGRSGSDGKSAALYLDKRTESDDVVAMFTFQFPHESGKTGCLICNFTSQNTNNIRGWVIPRYFLDNMCIFRDDIVIDCELAIYERPEAGHEEIRRNLHGVVPPSEVNGIFPTLLEDTEMKDVTFLVDGEEIAAHKLVLAARSPVFKAQLYGQMSENSMDCIPITDMKASVFRALLHYIYMDSLPNNVVLQSSQSDGCSHDSIIAAQYLLEAADRYGLDRLKLICEDHLRKTLNVDTVATTLAMAHQHGCNQLKAACLEYMLDPVIFVKVTFTQGYMHLRQSCPELMSEDYQLSVLDKICTATSTNPLISL